jgi:UDP-glucose 4-epimerase
MRILITGGAGFIGSHLADRLVVDGHQVTVLDNLSTGRRGNLAAHIQNNTVKFVEGSILDSNLLHDLATDTDYIFHLAAAVGVFNIVRNPLVSLLTNIRGTENVLEVAAKFGTPVFVASSSEVYGKNVSNSLKESNDRILGSPTTLRWSYSEAKAIDESLAYAYWVEKGLTTRIVRFFNTVGPRQLGSYGMVIPRFVSSAIRGEPLEVYGTGLQTRCFVHVLDVIDAIIAVAFSDKTVGQVINIGNSTEISIIDLANKVISDTDSKSKIEFVEYREAYGAGFEDMQRRVPNIELIHSLVGWAPSRSLTTMIQDVAQQIH